MRVIVFACLCCLSLNLFAENTLVNKFNVVFVTPDKEGNNFWDTVNFISKSTAKSLAIDIETYYVDSDRFAQQEAISEIAKRKVKPDYIIFRGFYGYTKKMFDFLESAKIYFITLEQALSQKESGILGAPQEKYKYWLGQEVYDNKAGGELLLNALLIEYKKVYPNQVMHIIGIGGDHEEVSQNRQAVLEEIWSSDNSKDIFVNQIFPMYWDDDLIKERFNAMVTRYPNTSAYWCAGDQMALTVLAEHQRISNKSLIIGGFDWTPMALKKIKEGELTASVGGHLLMVASALTKIYDYHHGVNRFLSDNGINQFELITQKNVDEYFTFIHKEQWKNIDFFRFTHAKSTNPPKLTFKNMIKYHNEMID